MFVRRFLRLLILSAGLLLGKPGWGQQPATADTTNGGWGNQPGWDVPAETVPAAKSAGKPKRVPYRVIRRQEKRQKRAYIRERQLRHAFGRFYRSRQGNWYVLSRRWGILEHDPHPYLLVACPALDRATFQDHFPYWQDRYGVYYALLHYRQQQIDTVAQADLATFRSLDFENLAVDKNYVYYEGYAVPGLNPATLRVYTPGGQRYGHPAGSGDAYLLGDTLGYQTPLFTPLSAEQVRSFRPPPGYQLAYPLPDSVTTRRR